VQERAVVSLKDYWVAPASGISPLPEAFIQRLASSHTGLLKPIGPTDPRLSWFVGQLQAIQRRLECSLIDIKDGWRPDDLPTSMRRQDKARNSLSRPSGRNRRRCRLHGVKSAGPKTKAGIGRIQSVITEQHLIHA
jgi:hypothetical protein